MSKQPTQIGATTTRLTWILLLILLAFLESHGFAEGTAPRIYKPGDIVEVDGRQTYKIISCTGTGEWDDCEVQPLDGPGGAPVGKPGKLSVRNLRAGEARLAKSRSTASPSPAPKPAPRATGNNPDLAPGKTSNTPSTGAAQSTACNFDPPAPAVTAASPFSEALAKRKIFDEYSWKANGTASAPLKIGVTFLAFELGQPFTNTVENVPGRGAVRRHEGAPANATIYTLKSKHMVCEQYRDGTIKRRIVEGGYTCFITKDGEWTCPSGINTKITPLD